MRSWSISCSALLLLSPLVSAFRTHIQRRTLPHASALQRSVEARASAASSGSTHLGNIENSQYIANITIGGERFTVILDTGSSDLWITGTVANSTDTGTTASIQYAIGQAAGDIHTAPVSFANFTVASQAFIAVTNLTSFGSISALGIQGLAGLGPGYNSLIKSQLGEKGDTLLDQIFQLNKTSENYVTFYLNRANDPASGTASQFTISEIIPGFENITSQPQLNVSQVSSSEQIDQHWTTFMDKIIGPDGNQIRLDSIVDHTPDGELVAVLDTGFTLPQVPRAVSDAIYGRVPGAQYDKKDGWWLIPCEQELNISFVFGGVTFPVHPFDTSSADFGAVFSDGTTACVGMFQPISTAFSLNGQFDMIMGEAFMRNAYSKFNLGDFVTDSVNARGNPYIQLLSTTNTAAAHADFVAVRLGGVDTTGESKYKLLAHGQSSPVSPGERVQHLLGFAERNETDIGVGVAIGLLVIIGLSGYFGWRKYKARRERRRENRLGGGKGGMLPLNSTVSLPATILKNGHGAAGGNVPMHGMGSYQTYQPNDHYPKQYS